MAGSASPPLFSVIVPCRERAIELKECLQALERMGTEPSFEIIVVDAASGPEVQAVVDRFPGVRMVRSQIPLDPGAARNLGVEASRGRILAFTDADCEPEPGWLAAAASGLSLGKRLVGGPVLHTQPFHPIRVADNMLQFADALPGRPNGPADYFPGCNLAVSREDFEALGGFPEVALACGEDVIFTEGAAARWEGGLGFVNAMRVRHLGRSRLTEYWRHQVRFGHCRAVLNLRLRRIHRRVGRSALAIVPVVAKRASYLLGRTLRWSRIGLLYWIPLSPLLLFGLLGWAVGFRRGCREVAACERAGAGEVGG